MPESIYMMDLPLITRFNDGVNNVTKNKGTHGGNAVWGNGMGLYEPEIRYPRGVEFQAVNQNMHIIDSVNNHYNFDGSKDWFASCMIRTSIGAGTLFARRSIAGFALLNSGGSANFFVDAGASVHNLLTSKKIDDGTHHHVLFAWRASDRTRRIYVDKKLDAVAPPFNFDYSQDDVDLYMGTNSGLGADYVGEYLFPRIGQFEPTQAEIDEIYERDLLRLNSKT